MHTSAMGGSQLTHHLPVLTTSSERAYRTCQKLYLYRYKYGYRALARPSYFAFGTAMHSLLEAWYLDYRNGLPELEWPSAEDEARGMAMMDAYIRHRGSPELEGWKVLQTEAEFAVKMSEFTLAGKIDMIVRDQAGDVWLVEHKTAASPPNAGKLTMDPQLLNYLLACESLLLENDLFSEVKGCIYNVLVKPKLKPRKAESVQDYQSRMYALIVLDPDAYFIRHKVEKHPRLISHARTLNLDIAESMAMSARSGVYPQNPYACHGYGFTCEFLDVCQGKHELEQDLGLARVGKEHTELTSL